MDGPGNRIIKKEKILIALSGGVDSAVAAALLKRQGHDVVGVYFRFFGSTWNPSFQVKKVARKLGIPLKIIDARGEFKKRVIDYFLNAYKIGLTPNPCVVCNKEMKFRMLFDLMKRENADLVATGHYAKIAQQSSAFPFRPDITSGRNSSKPSFKSFFKLLPAKDEIKDQSYFLYRLTQEDLENIVFPLGSYTKNEVGKLAKKFNLPVSSEKESQDICFINKGIDAFLKKKVKLRPGNIVDETGKILGKHQGLPLYTFGQRKGINLGGRGPYFVMGKNIGKNELTVTADPKKLCVKKFQVEKTNWIGKNIKLPLKAKVQIRYHAGKIPAIIKLGKSGSFSVETKKPLRSVTPGQSAVFHENKEILGGGIII
jgi:tRNA-specific 2-thiouridylase